MNRFCFRVFLWACLAVSLSAQADLVPVVDRIARVKEHRFGANGQLVPGEEGMKKIIIQWNEIKGAIAYQVCHNCRKTDEDGVLEPGEIHFVSLTATRAGRPAFMKPGAPLGRNTFHVRASVEEGKWGPWSEERVFSVQDPGNAHHEEL
jgi:hypothetical protein